MPSKIQTAVKPALDFMKQQPSSDVLFLVDTHSEPVTGNVFVEQAKM